MILLTGLLLMGVGLAGCSNSNDTESKTKNGGELPDMSEIKEKGQKKTVAGKEVIEYKTSDGNVIQMDPEAVEKGGTLKYENQ